MFWEPNLEKELDPSSPSATDLKIDGATYRAARHWVGLSLEELATAIDVSRGALQKIETGVTEPRKRTRAKLNEVLHRHGICFASGPAGLAIVRRGSGA